MNIKEIDDTKLQAAIARFESMHGAIEEVCPQFVGAVVEFAQEGLNDNWEAKYQDQHEWIQDRLHPIIGGDEIDVLMAEIVRVIPLRKINYAHKPCLRSTLQGIPAGGRSKPSFI